MDKDKKQQAYAGKITTVSAKLGDTELILEHGRFAEQATSAVFATMGGTQVMAIVTLGDEKKGADYFPMSVEYQERLYAGGKIKGSRWIKREGRPSDDAILIARLIDRSARPLFPKQLRNDLQIICLALSVDGMHDPAIVAGNAVFAALAISPVPWKGPIGVVHVGIKEGNLISHPKLPSNGDMQKEEVPEMDLVVSSSKDKVVMIEAGADQIPEDRMIEAIELAHKETKPIINAINELVEKVGQTKMTVAVTESNNELLEEVDKLVNEYVSETIKSGKSPSNTDIEPQILETFKATYDDLQIKAAFEKAWKKCIRKKILSGTRTDGRKYDEIRQIGADVGLLAMTHGSGIFRRGSTHVLSITALATPYYSQTIESAATEEVKRFIHHYSMPPYATGETGRIGVGRREIGHGALAEKALAPVIPSLEEFPYTIMVVSEVMSSNGSTSMGSTCGTTLSLMDAGVPLKAPVSGIAMGLISDAPGGPLILTDIAGIEDFNGDMDFKVAGTETGITAIQLDIKIDGLDLDLVAEVIKRARTARLEIMKTMLQAIDKPRDQVSAYAPKVSLVKIPVDKIGEVIGPGGRTIRQIIAETKAEVDVDDEGKVIVSCREPEGMKKALEWIKALTTDPEVGKIYKGKVMRIVPFGAFVEIMPGREGLVHITRMSHDFINSPEDVVHEGDEVEVKLFEVDDMGRLNLTMLLDSNGNETPRSSSENLGQQRMHGGGSSQGGYRNQRRNDRGHNDRRGGGGDRGNNR